MEGPTGDPDVLALRARQSRPILTTLLLSFEIVARDMPGGPPRSIHPFGEAAEHLTRDV